MKYPNFSEEKKLWKKGFKFVAGLDEAGRGPLAGPVVAAAVFLPKNFKNKKLKVKDSKKLSEKQREEIFAQVLKMPEIKYGVGIVSEKVIDKINILQATKLAMQKALRQAQGKPNRNADYLLIDGNFGIKSKLPQKPIVKGDQKVFSISLASIIAKVTRDRLMKKYHKKYPQYGFAQHKGYPTQFHRQKIHDLGPCKIHRKTFKLS